MTGPIPYGLHVISGELTEQDTNRIVSVIHRFLSFKDAAQLENLKQVHDLPDGGYFIVQHVAGIFRVIADKQEPEKFKFTNDGLIKVFVPMFFSGVVEKATVREGEKVRIKITEQCRRRLGMQLERTVPKDLNLERFTIFPNTGFPEFLPKTESASHPTQYQAHNPGWYSGSMAKLHQFVGGYGIQDFEQLPDNDIERIQLRLPEPLYTLFLEKYRNVRLPGYRGLPSKSGQFQYDYKASKTHAVAFDNENKPWLIQVTDKVYAMPLPVIPVTADPLFHQYVNEELHDSELMEILETFKAFPSGEGFPEGEEFRQWLRAGVIVEICDTADFSTHLAMFNACGWSFNNTGRIGYNTGFRYNEKGIIECTTFRMQLDLQATNKHYGTDKVDVGNSDLTDAQRSDLGRYLANLMASLPTENNLSRAIRYKIRHIPQSEILARAANISNDMSAEVNYWDNYVCEPIAMHKGKVIKLYTGKLFHHAKPNLQPQIKFPDMMMGFCYSFDFSPLDTNVAAPDCDTIMYAYFDDDTLKVVKYFYTARDFSKQVDTDYEQCMTVGSWYRTETTGKTKISGHFYLTDIDDRDEISPTVTHTTVKGVDKGYDTQPHFAFTHFYSMQGELWRNRYFTHLTKTETIRDKNIELAVLVPMFNRNCVVHANRVTGGNKITTESLELKYVQDPYTYKYWTYDAVFAWNTPLSKQTGKPYPKNGNPVWVEIQNYTPLTCSDFADQGPWIPTMPTDYGWLIHPDNNEWLHSGGGGPPKVREYSNTVTTPIETTGNLNWVVNDLIITILTKPPQNHYFLPSPDQYGLTMQRAGSKVFLGQVTYANINETNDAGAWKYTGYSNLANHNRVNHFIGVINE